MPAGEEGKKRPPPHADPLEMVDQSRVGRRHRQPAHDRAVNIRPVPPRHRHPGKIQPQLGVVRLGFGRALADLLRFSEQAFLAGEAESVVGEIARLDRTFAQLL